MKIEIKQGLYKGHYVTDDAEFTIKEWRRIKQVTGLTPKDFMQAEDTWDPDAIVSIAGIGLERLGHEDALNLLGDLPISAIAIESETEEANDELPPESEPEEPSEPSEPAAASGSSSSGAWDESGNGQSPTGELISGTGAISGPETLAT